MKNQNFNLGLFFIGLLCASSANAQFELISFAGKTVVQIAESAVLGVCFITNLNKNDVKDSFLSAVFSQNNPNITQCTLGCAVTGLYEGKATVQKTTGADLTKFVSNIIGTDLYGAIDDCFIATKDAKCSFISSYVSCILPKVITIIQNNLAGILNQAKNIITGLLKSAGDSVPAIKPFVQTIQNLLDIFFNIASTMLPKNNAGSSNSNNDWNPLGFIDGLFPKATTAATGTATIALSGKATVAPVVNTTPKQNQDPIKNLVDGIFKNIPIIG